MQKKKIVKTLIRLFLSTVISFGFSLFATVVKAEEQEIIIIKSGEDSEEVISTDGIDTKASHGKTVLSDKNLGISEVIIAQIGLENVKIVSQQDNRFQISFQIINRSAWIQPNVKYSVSLAVEDDTNNPFTDAIGRQVYDEELSLNGNEILKRKITYLAPTYLIGKYLLLVEARSPSGMLLGSQKADNLIILNGSQQSLEIISSSCYLSIEGSQAGKRYDVLEGILVEPQQEKLVSICRVVNHTDKQIKFTPNFKIYRQSIFGDETQNTQLKLGEFRFDPHETKIIVLPLPIDLNPQAYDVEVFLKSQEGIISNSMTMHYIIKGTSATIQNVAFDKPGYTTGGTAKIGFSWGGHTNQFFGSKAESARPENLAVNILIKDQRSDQICGQANKKLDPKVPHVYITIPITTDCEKPFVVSIIKDELGNILARRESQPSQRTENLLLKSNKIIAISVLTILLVIFLIITFFLNGENNSEKKKGKKYKHIVNKK